MGGLSMEWKEVTLGDFMQCNPKRTIKKGQKARKITMDLLIPHSKTIRNWNYEPYSGGAKFQNGDTIMARITPCLENGKHAFVSILDEGEIAYGSTEYFVFCGKEKVSDNDFVYYLTKTPLFRDTAIKSMVGSSGRQRAQMDVLENLKMFVPKDISDQRRIASILSSLDRKIDLNNKINADLEEMAQAIFKNWFVDFEPFKDGKFVDSELGMIPEGWKVGTLADIAEITMGQSPAGNSLNENREGMIFYQGSSDFGFRFPSIRVFTTEPKRLAVANSVLFSVRAPVGDINVAKEECCIGRGVASIKSKYGHDSYLFYTMKSLHKLFDSFDGEGTVFGSINKKTLSAIQILLPSDGIVEQFNNIASSFDDRIRSLSDESSRLSLLRDTLLPRLMSGELEVPE